MSLFWIHVYLAFFYWFVRLKLSEDRVGLQDWGAFWDDEVGMEGDWDKPHKDAVDLADDQGWSEVDEDATGL